MVRKQIQKYLKLFPTLHLQIIYVSHILHLQQYQGLI